MIDAELVAFVVARLDEREAVAKAATPGPWMTGAVAPHLVNTVVYGQSAWPGHIQQAANTDYAEHKAGNADHVAVHDPAWALRDVAAKRAIVAAVIARPHLYIDGDCWFSCSQAVDELGGEPGSGCCDEGRAGRPCDCGRDTWVRQIIGSLASVDNAHPDYKPEWAPAT